MLSDQIRRLFKKLMPNGRAFKIPYLGDFERLLNGLATVFAAAYNNAKATMHVILPDNDDFSIQDAEYWERCLGIPASSSTSLANRKAAILRKMRHPGTIKARQNWRYVQKQLQDAGFAVYVHENKFPSSPPGSFITMSPNDVFGSGTESLTFFDGTGNTQWGGDGVQFGSGGFPKVVNYLEAEKDEEFIVGTHFRNTFYIGGQTFPDYADVAADREIEFRQLILLLKPQHSAAYLLINYV